MSGFCQARRIFGGGPSLRSFSVNRSRSVFFSCRLPPIFPSPSLAPVVNPSLENIVDDPDPDRCSRISVRKRAGGSAWRLYGVYLRHHRRHRLCGRRADENFLSHPDVKALNLELLESGGEKMEKIYPNLAGRARALPFSSIRPVPSKGRTSSSPPFRTGSPRGSRPPAWRRESFSSTFPRISASAPTRRPIPRGTDRSYAHPELHAVSVYGLPELNRAGIAKARIIGNPGCYPTCAELGLFPALRLGIAEREGIVIDAKSGVTGAGREPTKSTHYPEIADSIVPYKIGQHRHTPEIAATLEVMAGHRSAWSSRPSSRRWAGE